LFVGKRNTGTGALGLNSGGLNPSLVQDNVGLLETTGIDMQVDYSVPLFNGDLSFTYLGTWLDKYRNTPVALLPLRENIVEGTYGLPDYRHNFRVTYEQGAATFSARWRYEAPTQDFRVENSFVGNDRVTPTTLPLPEIGAWNYFDLSLGLDVDERMTINAGVNNLFDKQAPVLGAQAEQANTLPSFFDVLGRDFFVGVNFRF
jgi:outer membrane receptor protein involved in Fe transport